ncbi:phosphoribosyl transferase [Acidithiobacillus caldus]|uniref:phosphoribosyltransferase n=1 Tax=Acidithiobacillus caldus TaxID=33059 RepID=UPI001C067E0F|nr:phosphoribosyl transferase [Acidithiobacillus caldus]MBU2820531.1 phosphoribosyl transferase [Acidithiobacillus caldus]
MPENQILLQDREEAAELLVAKLAPLAGNCPLILAIPRGAVPMAWGIANALGGELDVVLIRKIGLPGNPELGIAAIDESGQIWLSPQFPEHIPGSKYLRSEAARQLAVIRPRRKRYAQVHTPIDPKDRVVIVVDDGAATGSTMVSALRYLRQKHPARLIATFAVASTDALALLRPIADDLIYLAAPEPFFAVGTFFQDFREVSDDEVLEILRKSRSRYLPHCPPHAPAPRKSRR